MPDLIPETAINAATAAYVARVFEPGYQPQPSTLRNIRASVTAYLTPAAKFIVAQAQERLAGPYRCCQHCADDQPHIEQDTHTVSCQLCQDETINRAKAQAWDEGKHSEHTVACRWGTGDCICPNPYRIEANS